MKTEIHNECLDMQQLVLKRDELQNRLAKIKADVGGGLNRDSAERAVELENSEVLNEIARVTIEELQNVEAMIAHKRACKPG